MTRPWGGAEQVAVVSAREMRSWEAHSFGELGVESRVLMESAGRAAAGIVQHLYPAGRVAALVGPGNNGGDAVVALRTLLAWGREVVAVSPGPLDPALLHGWSIPAVSPARIGDALTRAAVVLDGLLGTGSRGAPREPYAAMIRAANASGRPVVALDGPSGVDFDTGQTAGEAIQAEITVTFAAPKRGLLRFPGRVHSGRIVAVEIGLPSEPPAEAALLVTPAWAQSHLPVLPPNAHKGTMGTVVVVAGSEGSAGAAALAARGALRSGAGKVVVVSRSANRVPLQTTVPEALWAELEGERWREAVAAADAVVAGPGMGTDAVARAALTWLLRETRAPMLLDADALTILAEAPELWNQADRSRLLLTPHPKEMARLLARPIAELLDDPFGAAGAAVERWGAAVLLKGHPSLVAAPRNRIRVSVAGHAGVATGGMGDTLAGIAGTLLAEGLPPVDAGAVALFLAGRAAELAGGGRSLLPGDVAERLPIVWGSGGPVSTLGLPGVILDLLPAH